jgi:hemoglobin-like flavoprotein
MIGASTVFHPRKVPNIGVDVEAKSSGARIEYSVNNKFKSVNTVIQSKTNSNDVAGKKSNTHTPLVPHLSRSPPNPEKCVQNATYSIKIDCTKRLMSSEINYDTVYTVIGSWQDKILRIPNWSLPTGESFLRHIFRLAPETITMFGFPPETKFDDPKLSENTKFTTKGARLIKAIDMAAMFLGPDLEPFEQELYSLGWRHVAMQARPEHWPVVGEALLCTFEDCMIGGFTQEERNAWTIVSWVSHFNGQQYDFAPL